MPTPDDFKKWQEQCAKWAEKLVNLDDILAPDDPYELFEVMRTAFKDRQNPRSFIEEVFEEDLARRAYDDHLYAESLEQGQE